MFQGLNQAFTLHKKNNQLAQYGVCNSSTQYLTIMQMWCESWYKSSLKWTKRSTLNVLITSDAVPTSTMCAACYHRRIQNTAECDQERDWSCVIKIESTQHCRHANINLLAVSFVWITHTVSAAIWHVSPPHSPPSIRIKHISHITQDIINYPAQRLRERRGLLVGWHEWC